MPELAEILMVSSVSQSIMTDQPLGAASPFDYNVKSSSINKIDKEYHKQTPPSSRATGGETKNEATRSLT